MSEITHEATIVDIKKNTITVELVKTEACKSCAINNVCQQKKTMSLYVDNPENFSKGQKINVFIAEKQAVTAIFWGYVFPLILVILSLFLALHYTGSEVIAAIVSLIVFPLYYLGIYFFDNKLKKILSVRIEQP